MHVEEEVLGQSVDHQDGRLGVALRFHTVLCTTLP